MKTPDSFLGKVTLSKKGYVALRYKKKDHEIFPSGVKNVLLPLR